MLTVYNNLSEQKGDLKRKGEARAGGSGNRGGQGKADLCPQSSRNAEGLKVDRGYALDNLIM